MCRLPDISIQFAIIGCSYYNVCSIHGTVTKSFLYNGSLFIFGRQSMYFGYEYFGNNGYPCQRTVAEDSCQFFQTDITRTDQHRMQFIQLQKNREKLVAFRFFWLNCS